MLSGSSWHKWRRTLLALFFIIQYHWRMFFLNLRYKARNVPHTEIVTQAHSYWNGLRQSIVAHKTFSTLLRTTQKKLENEQLTGALRVVKKNLKDERLRTALKKAKKKLEQLVFIEETPTQQADHSSLEKLKTAWHSLETSKIARVTPEALKTARHSLEIGKISRIAPETLKAVRHPLRTLKAVRDRTITLITLGVTSLLLITLFAASGLASQALHTVKTIGVASFSQIAASELNIEAQQAPAVDASKALARISQLDEGEYASLDEYPKNNV